LNGTGTEAWAIFIREVAALGDLSLVSVDRLPSPIWSTIPVSIRWIIPTVVTTIPGAVVPTVAISGAVIPRVVVNDMVALGIRIGVRLGVGLIAVDDDDRLRLGGCGHAYRGSAQHRTGRECRENCLFHFDTPPVSTALFEC
jgi:hypothetical protein